jgi:hypothetical protein
VDGSWLNSPSPWSPPSRTFDSPSWTAANRNAVREANQVSRSNDVVQAIRALCELFAAHCEDRARLDALAKISGSRGDWHQGRQIFDRARVETLKRANGGPSLDAQLIFEETCGKALYNLSGHPAPFDVDAPYWVVPNAVGLAKRLGIDEREITRIVAE